MKTRECADELSVTTEFIVREIQDGRLPGRVMTRTSGRTIYRIERAAFEGYRQRYWRHSSS